MLIVISYCHRDYLAAMRLGKLIGEKTDLGRHQVMFYGSEHARLPGKEVEEWFSGNCGVGALKCSKDPKSYPLGANYMFAGLCQTLGGSGELPELVYLMEADVCPRVADWADRVEEAHLAGGKRVSGHFVDWIEPEHLNGSLVLERSVILENPVLSRPVVEAWDVHHAELLLKHGGDNAEILLARKTEMYMPTEWWLELEKGGHRSAVVHGCRGFALLDHYEREGFGAEILRTGEIR